MHIMINWRKITSKYLYVNDVLFANEMNINFMCQHVLSNNSNSVFFFVG